MQPDIDGAAEGEMAKLERALHPDARIFGAVGGQRAGQFDCNRLGSCFFGDGLDLTTATDDPSFLVMYFAVIVTVPSLLVVSVRSVLLIRRLLN